MLDQFVEQLRDLPSIRVGQRHELGEWLGFETRNKYAIETEQGAPIGFAAEQQKGWLSFFIRQLVGHWRTFEIQFFDQHRQPVLRAVHPFRWFFQRLEVFLEDGTKVGAIQQRFSILTKSFDVEDATGQTLLTVRSGLFRIWTFVFKRGDQELARVEKKWSGILSEAFTDRDQFRVKFSSPALADEERLLLLAASVFIDLQYFEKKGGGQALGLLDG